jgi:hypothetical protein
MGNASTPHALDFPVSFSAKESSDNVELVSLAHESLPADFVNRFTDVTGERQTSIVCRFDPVKSTNFCVFTNAPVNDPTGTAFRVTTLNYSRHAGKVTFFSSQYTHQWSNSTGQDDFFSFNNTDTSGDGLDVHFGNNLALDMELKGAGDAARYTVTPVLELVPFDDSSSVPYSCVESGDSTMMFRNCQGSDFSSVGKSGSVFRP